VATERIISYADAIREATDQEMDRDAGVVVFGLGVDDPHLQYGTLRGLVDKYGPERVFDTPISEDAMTGFAVGAGMAGVRPIHVHIRMDFLMLTMNQIVNYAAKAHYMFGGAVSVPIVVRSVIGRSWGQGGQHSQGLHAMFMHVPGLRVVAPTTPHDAKATLLASIRDDNPVMFVEHRMLHGHKGHVPEAAEAGPIGRARVLAEGGDVTLIGVSHAVVECLRAAHALAAVGIAAEVVDPVWLAPLDAETIVASARKTGRVLVVDSGWTTCGASAEILARIVEATQDGERVRVERMGFAPTTCPTTPSLEEPFYPDASRIAARAYALLRPSERPWTPTVDRAAEIAEFKGPF
jgi:acetoin:2,6-dichlorophenolindophenol oxidoreductase subunit beta